MTNEVLSVILVLTAAVVGAVTGYAVARTKKQTTNPRLDKQQREKNKRLSKVEAFIDTSERITNRDVQDLLKVSDATAARYLNELEQNGRLVQHGKSGRGVYYTRS